MEEEEEERIIVALAGLIDQIDPDVNLVNLSTERHLVSTSSDLEDDIAFIPLYCPIDMIPEQYRHVRVVSRADLVELDRLSPCVDLVSYRSQPGSRAVFKYQFHTNQALRTWHEFNCWLRLSGHPNIVPLDCIVTDHEDVPGHGTVEVIVGFTSVFVPGKTLEDNHSRLFKMKHLNQLIEVVDDLNLKFGIVHQDIAPRNLLINPDTDTLLIFDFSCSGKLGWRGEEKINFSNHGHFRSDLKAVVATVYEVITRDTPLAEQILQGADIATIEDKEWVQHPDVQLETDVAHYRQILRSWLERRNRPENLITHYTQTPNPLEWPLSWRPTLPILGQRGEPTGETRRSNSLRRSAHRALGLKYVEWGRPAHNKIPDGFRVLGDGTLIAEADLQQD